MSLSSKRCVFLLLTFFSNLVFSGEAIPLENIIKPDGLKIDGERNELFIVQGAKIFVFSLEGFKLKNELGKKGEGPGEFMPFPWGGGVHISFNKDYLFVSSLNKLSYFTRDGKLKNEIRTNQFILKPTIFKDKIVNQKDFGDKTDFILFNLEGKEIKQICSRKMAIIKGKNIAMEDHYSQVYPFFQTSKDQIFISGEDGFTIDVFSGNGDYLRSLKNDYKRVEVTASERQAIFNYYRNHPMLQRGDAYERLKSAIPIPKYLPYYKTFLISDEKLYVQTYKKNDDKTEFLVFSLEGNLLKQTYLPLVFKDLVTPCLYTINAEKIYQLILNMDSDEYELYVTDIK